MVPWWKRLIYSLGSVIVGAGAAGALVAGREFISSSHGHVSAMGLTIAGLGFDCWVVILSLPGWLLAIPVVLLVRYTYGWRFWMYWALGTCVGPALILGVALYSALRAPNLEGFPGDSMSVVYLAGAISFLSTLLYLLLLRRARIRAAYGVDVTVV